MHSIFSSRRIICLALGLGVMGLPLIPSNAAAQQKFEIKNVAEKKLKLLPAGPLYWRVENLPTLAQAEAAAGETSLAAEVSGKVWLFTLGPKGGSTPGAIKVTEIGPVPTISAAEYLLRINHAGGPPGAKTPVHTHPGSEAFYVLAGRLGQKDSPWCQPYGCWPSDEWTRSRHADGSFQRRHLGSGPARHVRGGCEPSVLITGET